MNAALALSFKIFDRQQEEKLAAEMAHIIELEAMEAAWIELNNLYLSIERGDVELNVHTANQLRTLVGKGFTRDDDIMRDYWQREFEKLDGWNNV